MTRRFLPAALACALLVTPQSARSRAVAPAHFAVARSPYRFTFPRDHGAHDAYQTEWWYFTGHLRTPHGRSFGFETTFFRFGIRAGDRQLPRGGSRWRRNEAYLVHFAITDERDHRFYYTVRSAREALGMGGASRGVLAVHVDDWTLRSVPNSDPVQQRMTIHVDNGAEALRLSLAPQKRPAIHGEGGISRKGPCSSCASHYYSYTRIATRGTLTYDGVPAAVSGISWMDHEFGSAQLTADQVGWDWFSVQLNDGRELMLYLLRRRDGSVTPESSGSLIERNGRVDHLRLSDFSVRVRGGTHWHSTHTGASYPSLWEVRVPRARLWLSLSPTVADQELAITPRSLAYWEGAVDVADTANGGTHIGQGYVELTGYAAAVVL